MKKSQRIIDEMAMDEEAMCKSSGSAERPELRVEMYKKLYNVIHMQEEVIEIVLLKTGNKVHLLKQDR